MYQVIDDSDLENLLEIAKAKTKEYSILARFMNMTVSETPENLFSIILNPKRLDQKFADEMKIHQKQFSWFFAKAISNFGAVKGFLNKYCANDGYLRFLLDLEEEATKFRESVLYKTYPEMEEYEGVVLRNDFFYDKEKKGIYQIENNTMVVGGSHFSGSTIKFLRRIFFQLNAENLVKSNFYCFNLE